MKRFLVFSVATFLFSAKVAFAQGLFETSEDAQEAYESAIIKQVEHILVAYHDQHMVQRLDMRPTVLVLRGVFDCHSPATKKHRYYVFRLLGLVGFDKILLDMQKIPAEQTEEFAKELEDLRRYRRSFTQWDRFKNLEERRFFYEIADQHPEDRPEFNGFSGNGFFRPSDELRRIVGAPRDPAGPYDDPLIVATALEPEGLPSKWDARAVPPQYKYLVLNLRREPAFSADQALFAGYLSLFSDENSMEKRADYNDFTRATRCTANAYRAEEKKPFINFDAFFGIER